MTSNLFVFKKNFSGGFAPSSLTISGFDEDPSINILADILIHAMLKLDEFLLIHYSSPTLALQYLRKNIMHVIVFVGE